MICVVFSSRGGDCVRPMFRCSALYVPSRRRSNGVLVPRESDYSGEMRVEDMDEVDDDLASDDDPIPVSRITEWPASPRRSSGASVDSSRSRSSTHLASVHEGTPAHTYQQRT